MLISYFLLNKQIYEYTYDIWEIFLVLNEIRKILKYIRNANTSGFPKIMQVSSVWVGFLAEK